MNNKKKYLVLGFTLIELMIVLSIVGITLGMAVPSFQNIIASNRLTSAANNLLSALQLAKSEAIKTNYLTIVSKNTSWANGWIVFADKNQNGSQDIATEPTISSFDALSAGYSVVTTDAYTNTVTYRPDGRSSTNGSFYLCSSANAADFRRVVIASTGRARVETPAKAGISYATACQ